MNSRSGLSFADVLIILAIVLLLAALAAPKFIKATDYGTEEDEVTTETNTADTATGGSDSAPPSTQTNQPENKIMR